MDEGLSFLSLSLETLDIGAPHPPPTFSFSLPTKMTSGADELGQQYIVK